MRSAEWFGQIRDSVLGLSDAEEHVAEMRSALVLKAQSYEGHRQLDYTRPNGVDELLDAERSVSERGLEVSSMKGEAMRVLFGPMSRAGVAKMLGRKYANVLYLRYVEALPWTDVAEELGWTTGWCMALANRALAWIDEVGWARIEEENELEEEWAEQCREEA